MVKIFFITLVLLFSSFFKVYAANIVATISPLASMVAPVLTENDRLTVVLPSGQTPHGFQLKPSHVMAFEKADIILTVGSGVDAWASKALKRYPKKVVNMQSLPGLIVLPVRKSNSRKSHEAHHHHHGHEVVKNGHLHEKIKQDGHLWLAPLNGKLFVKAFGQKMQSLGFVVDKEKLSLQLALINEVDSKLQKQLQPVQDLAFVVLHDAFRYFEDHYGLNNVGAIHLNPQLKPSIKNVLSIQKRIQSQQVACVFKQPQYPKKWVAYVLRETEARIGNLDPLNSQGLPYAEFLQQLGDGFSNCLLKP